MNTQPLVSVLTPSFNQGMYLPDALLSVANQTYPRIEHIVMDGASTDNSVAILMQAERHVKWMSEPDGGQSDAINKAFAISQGEIIGWINSDDGYADRRTVEWVVETFLSEPDVDVIFGHALLIDERNAVLQVLRSWQYYPWLVRQVHYPVQPTFFFRRRVLERLPWLLDTNLNYVMDRDLMLRLDGWVGIKRLDRILALDRHQRNRKVATTAFADERETYDRSVQTWLHSRTLSRAATPTIQRLSGIPLTVALSTSLEPAIDLVIPSLRKRLELLLLRRRSSMVY